MSKRIFTSDEVQQLKQEARTIQRMENIPYCTVLNRIAVREGFEDWRALKHLSDHGSPVQVIPKPRAKTAEEVLGDLYYELGAYLTNNESRVLGAMAETNAQPFFIDELEVETAEFVDDEDCIRFTANVLLTGDQDLERPFNGDEIRCAVSGLAVRAGGEWTFDVEVSDLTTNAFDDLDEA